MRNAPALRGGTLKLIRGLASRGVRDVDIANALRLTPGKFRQLKANNPKVAAAYEEGRAEEHSALRDALFDSAMKGNVVAAIFLLKARHGYNDRPEPAAEAGRVTVEFKLPAPLAPEQYIELTKVAQRPSTPLIEGAAGEGGGD